jgi:hypothetical protein
MLAQKNARNIAKRFQQQEEFAEMAKRQNRDQVIVHISMENGVPRVRPLTAKEQKQFFKTHPKSQLPILSGEEINRRTDAVEINQIADPSTLSVVNDPAAK